MRIRVSPLYNQLVLVQTHIVNDEIVTLFNQIRDAVGGLYDVKLLFHNEVLSPLPVSLPEDSVIQFTTDDLAKLSLNYYRETLIPGCQHYPLYYVNNILGLNYEYFWVIEYDVRFSGDWKVFFSHFETAKEALITGHLLRRSRKNAKWPFWDLKNPPFKLLKRVYQWDLIRSFLPVYRISSSALTFLYEKQQAGWRGHSEAIIPTLLHKHGFRLRDFGGVGEFTPSQDKQRFYDAEPVNIEGRLENSSYRYRPVHVTCGYKDNYLYHPVKPLSDES